MKFIFILLCIYGILSLLDVLSSYDILERNEDE